MKFENIKVGDTVFTEREVSHTWNSIVLCFSVPETVMRVTKTQFVVQSGDRYKKEGYKINGGGAQAYFDRDYKWWRD